MTTPLRPPRYFTVAEANKMLPLVKAIVADIVALAQDVKDRQERLRELRTRRSANRKTTDAYSEEVHQMEDELEADVERLKVFIEELSKLGVEMKDPLTGLVDFRSKMDGREVYLCWRHGEAEVEHWHELDAGFAGRQHLMERAEN
jgi:hypothetical protein